VRRKKSAEKKTITTAESLDLQVAIRWGLLPGGLPAMKKRVEAGLSCAEMKRRMEISPTWGVRISGEPFKERAVP
jgi:hypothetical protein